MCYIHPDLFMMYQPDVLIHCLPAARANSVYKGSAHASGNRSGHYEYNDVESAVNLQGLCCYCRCCLPAVIRSNWSVDQSNHNNIRATRLPVRARASQAIEESARI